MQKTEIALMPALKIRIAHGTITAMGPGKADLLRAIESTGSISGAAKAMKMSYRRAWQLVDAMNACYRLPLVETAMGGTNGGGAKVTDFGFHILKCYEELVRKSELAAAAELKQLMDFAV
jgi:molybdate transport system regulatory protein